MKSRLSVSAWLLAMIAVIPAISAAAPSAYPSCTVYMTDPARVMGVPRNADWDVYYRAVRTNLCQHLIRFTDASGRVIPVQMIYANELPDPTVHSHQSNIFFGVARFHPKKVLPPETKVTVVMGKTVLTHFVTASSAVPEEGALLGEDPATLSVPLCPHTSHLSRDEVASCLGHYWEWYYRFLAGLIDHPVSPPVTKEQNLLVQKRETLMRAYSMQTLMRGLPNLFDQHSVFSGVALSRVRYESKNPTGQGLVLSSLLVTPLHVMKSSAPLPLIVLLHGYVSRESAPSDGNMALVVLAIQLSAQGFSVLLPDYIGHGVSQKEVEPFLIASSAYDVIHDNLRAVKEMFPEWDGHVAILGASQGAYNALSFYRMMLYTPHDHVHVDDLFISEGPYHTQRAVSNMLQWYMNPFWDSNYTHYVTADAKTWLRYFYAYLSTNEHYGFLPSGTLSHIYTTPSHLNKVFLREFLSGSTGLSEHLSATLTYSTLINTHDRYVAPDLYFRVYGYRYDPLVPYGNTEDLLAFLRMKQHVFGNLQEGSCRVGSELEHMSRYLSQLNPMMLHGYCSLVSYDDFLSVMRMRASRRQS